MQADLPNIPPPLPLQFGYENAQNFSQDSLKMFLGGVLKNRSEPALHLLEGVQRGKTVVFGGTEAGLQHDQPEELADSGSELALGGFWHMDL